MATMRWLQCAAGVAMLAAAGCGSSLPTASVSGVVTYQGQPVEGATVLFQPTDTEKGKSASGVTDAAGKFTLTTYVDPDNSPAGALPGEYQISVTKIQAGAAMTPEDMVAAAASGRPPTGPQNLLPFKYANPMSSGLTASVPAGGVQDLKFDLVD